jgi:hypothetical protein
MPVAPWLRYLIAVVVTVHGFVYLGPGSPVRAFDGWRGNSWLLDGALADGALRSLAAGLHVVAGIVTLACAAAIAFAPVAPAWWRPLAILAGVAGLAAFGVYWDGQAGYLFHQGVVGAVISLALLLSAIVYARACS